MRGLEVEEALWAETASMADYSTESTGVVLVECQGYPYTVLY